MFQLSLAKKLIAKNKRTRAPFLDLGNCGLKEIPQEVADLVWLESLTLGPHNPEKGWQASQNKGEPNSLADLSPLSGLSILQTFSCDSTQVSDLSPLAGLTALQTLSCSDTPVSDLTPLACLTALQKLYCYITPVSDLSPLSGLSGLQTLYCSSTQVSDLSPLAGLTDLQSLSCDSTPVSDLSPLAGLTALQSLSCDDTQVTDLSPLAGLTTLEELSCNITQVSDLSPLLPLIRRGLAVKWSSHSWEGPGIYIADCPLTNPPPEIVKQGNDAILNYFAERASGAVDHLYEAKMLVLGEGGSGKTSLIQRLYYPELKELPKEDQSTKGIVIQKHEFPLKNGRTFRLNVWDFGGQQIYHATHQFFLTQRSLYVLLDDTRKDNKSVSDEGFRYWLELIEVFGGHSPTLIFQNEKSGRSKAIDFEGIQRQYTNVKQLYSGDLEKAGSADKIRKGIEHFAETLPHIGEELPAAWVKIRAEIEELSKQKHCIPVEDYLALCAPHLNGDDRRALFLSSYLHDLGVFLHFQDDSVLRKTVILQNEWATTAVFRILDDEIVKKKWGHFTPEDCARIWQDSGYADKHHELRALMEKFELCYKLRDKEPSEWLSPQLVVPSEPTALKNWGKPSDLILRYKYAFLPKGMISRLTVRLHRFVANPENAWGDGVLLEQGSTQVLVKILGPDEIELRARGPAHTALLGAVAADLDTLNDSFKGLQKKVDKRIPCNCEKCRAAELPHFFAHSDLLYRKEHGKSQVECPKSFEDVSVSTLLEGVEKHTALRTIRVFLASSSELFEERDAFELHFRRLNDQLIAEGVYLEIVRWENFLDCISELGLQNEYNQSVRDCDVFVSLFFTKAGKYTVEEFDVAYKQYITASKPLIYTYFKDAPVTTGGWKKEDHDSIDALKKKLQDLGHYPTVYSTTDSLILHFRNQLPMIRKKLNLWHPGAPGNPITPEG